MRVVLADAVLLAHGGGVPEALSIGLPLLAVGALVLMERSARRKAREAEQQQQQGEPNQ